MVFVVSPTCDVRHASHDPSWIQKLCKGVMTGIQRDLPGSASAFVANTSVCTCADERSRTINVPIKSCEMQSGVTIDIALIRVYASHNKLLRQSFKAQ